MTEPHVIKFSRADPSITCPVSISTDYRKDNSDDRVFSKFQSTLSTLCRNSSKYWRGFPTKLLG